MTVTASSSKVVFAGNGATTVFSYSFAIPTGAEVVTYTPTTGIPVTLAPGSYTITGEGQPTAGGGGQGGTLTYAPLGLPIPIGTTLTLQRIVPYTQAVSFSNQSGLWPSVVEGSEDTLEEQIQQTYELASRALVVSISEVGPELPLPPAAVRANQYLIFDSNGNPTTGLPVGNATVSSVMQAVVDSSTRSGALALLGGVGPVGYSVSVLSYGATGNGVTDDTAAIQAALVNDDVFFPPGTYKTSSTLTSSVNGQRIRGAGMSTIIAPTSLTADVFNLSGFSLIVSDMEVVPVGTQTGGFIFNFTNTSGNVFVDNIFTYGGFNVIGFNGAGMVQTYVSNCTFDEFLNTCIVYGPGYGGFGNLSGLTMNAVGSGNPAGNCILVQNGDTFNWTNLQSQGCYVGVNIVPASGNFVVDVFATNCLMDGVGMTAGGPRWLINGGISGNVGCGRISLTNCWAGAGPGHGFQIVAATDVGLVNCKALSNGEHGFYLTGAPTDVRMTGCIAAGNSRNASNTYNGFQIDDGVIFFSLVNCRSGQTYVPDVGNTQQWGINVTTGPSDHYVILGCCTGMNVTGGIFDGGSGTTNKSVTGNIN
jgi:hypothetical protein